MKKATFVSVAILSLALGACTADISPNNYYASSAQTINTVKPCTVVSVRPVNVNSSNNNAGTLLGAAAGGVAGSAIGSGRTVPILGAIGGAVVGGIAGDAAQKQLSHQTGFEYVVRFDNGSMASVVQGNDTIIQPGQRCMLLYGDQARVVPAN